MTRIGILNRGDGRPSIPFFLRRFRSPRPCQAAVHKKAASIALAVELIAGTAAFGIATPLPAAAAAGSAQPTREVASSAAIDPVIFDNFNRTVSNGWANGWYTNVIPEQCPSFTTSVDGSAGRLTRVSATGGCFGGDAFNAKQNGWWTQMNAWTFVGKVKVSDVAGGIIQFRIRRDMCVGCYLARVTLNFSSSSGSVGHVGGSVPFSWLPNTYYSVKWVHAWGDQDRVKVWPSATAEPADWLLTSSAAGEDTYYVPNSWFEAGYGAPAPAVAYFDDFGSGPAPILPTVPPPPGTEHNPPYTNERDSGDPVSTLTGTFSDRRVDVAIPGRGPAIEFARAYNSNDTRVTTLGPGWTHNYNTRLTSPGDATSDIVFVGPQGRSDRYVDNGGGYVPPPGIYRSLVRNPDDTYTATEKDQTVWRFDASGRLLQILDRFGNTSVLGYASDGRLTSISDPAGRGSLTLGYSGNLLTSITDWSSPARSVTYAYDSQGRLWRVTDREGRVTIYTYDGATSRIASVTDRRNIVVLANTYDAEGRVATQQDGRGVATGQVTTFSYADNADGTSTTTVSAPATSFEPSFHPTLSDTYDSAGNLIARVTRPSSSETLQESFTYDANGNKASRTDAAGARTDFCYDVDYAGATVPGSAGSLTRTISPAPRIGVARPVSLFRYDAKNNVIQSVPPRGVASTPTTTCGSDLSAINPQFVTDSTYDSAGVLLLAVSQRYTDPDTGVKTATTKYEYADSANPGLVTRIIPPRGNTGAVPDGSYATVMSYFATGSAAGLLKDITDPLGNKTSYTYDAVSRVTSLVDPLGNASGGVAAEHTTSFGYDREDRVLTTTRPAPGAAGAPLVTQVRYDPAGNPAYRIDPSGQVTKMTYDERGSVATVVQSAAPWTDPSSSASAPITTEYTHDAGGNVTRVTRAKGDPAYERVTDYTYDGRGLRRSETQFPNWPSTSGALQSTYTYDEVGDQKTLVDALGRTTTYDYDTLSRLTSIDYSDPGTPDATFSYDADGNRVGMSDGTGSSSYVFDELGRVVTASTPGPSVVGYRYDLDGLRTKLIYPDGTAVSYQFDKAGRMSGLTDWASRSVTYVYWPDGLLKASSLPDGSTASYAYDNARRLTEVSHDRLSTTISRQSYSLDPNGNVTRLVDQVLGLTPVPTWSPPTAVNNVTTSDQTQPSVATGPDGAVFAVWADNRTGDSDVYFSRLDPTSGVWGPSERVNHVTTGSQTEPVVVFDPLGNTTLEGPGGLWVAWTDTRNGPTDADIYWTRRKPDGTWWTSDQRLNDDGAGRRQSAAALAVRPDGGATAVWYDERGGGAKKNIYTASLGLTANVKITSDSNSAKGDPEIAIDAAGNAYVVWRDNRSGNPDIWFSSLPRGSASWSANVKISDDPGAASQESPTIGVDAAGNLLAVWGDSRTGVSQIRASRRVAGSGTWSASTPIGGSAARAPSLGMLRDGRAFVAWSNGTAGSLTTIWGSQYDPTIGIWSAPVLLTDTADESASAGVAYSADQLVLAYQRRVVGGNWDVFARRQWLSGSVFSFGYDTLDRLTSVTGPDGPRTYEWDPVGNRTVRVSGLRTSYSYDRADRMTTAGGEAITTDANGNIVVEGGNTFTYDQANRLVTAVIAGTSELYAYDGTGLRFSRRVGSDGAIRYASDISGKLPRTIDDGSRKYVYGVGLEYAVSDTGIDVYHADRLGSIRAITNAAGAVSAAYRLDEWGLVTAETGVSTQPVAFAGETSDATGLSYLRARYYNPDLGRFMSRDAFVGSPLQPQSLNRYAYAAGNPMVHTDPTGMFFDVFIDIGFVVIDLGGLVFGPEKDRGDNWTALALDVGSAFVPFVAGGGLIYRAAKSEEKLAKFFRIAEHVDTRTLEAARQELKGVVVKINEATGLPYDHVREIRDSQNGLLKLIQETKQVLEANPDLPAEERARLESVLSQASQMLDWTEQYVPR